MKRILLILLVFSLFCFVGCSEEAEPGTRYNLIGIQLSEGGYMDNTALQQSGAEDYYIHLYDDGTAKLKIQKGDPVDMVYDDLYIWRTDTPDVKAAYYMDGDTLSILDYPFEYHFEK